MEVSQACVVRYFAAVKAAAGVGEDRVPAATLAEALSAVRGLHGGRFTEVLACCSYVVDGDPVGGRAHEMVPMMPGSIVDCLPPFAGG
ncbi:MAG: Molybdopterin converting factor [Frankiales bacterium]|nr:Molybdopterin converting factor [Frankiales bacterium]